jgi:hypothetical protein
MLQPTCCAGFADVEARCCTAATGGCCSGASRRAAPLAAGLVHGSAADGCVSYQYARDCTLLSCAVPCTRFEVISWLPFQAC